MLVLDRLAVLHPDGVALHPTDLDLPAGTLAAVTGPSGAGKSSLLLAIAGRTAHTGAVIWHAAPLDPVDVALVPQGNHLAPVLTALENIVLPLAATGRPDAVSIAEAALGAVGLAESGGHLVEELSGGQQQRVAVARALARSADVVMADECTSDLDGVNREKVLAALRAEARRGGLVLFATNDLDAAAECDVHLALDAGHLTRLR